MTGVAARQQVCQGRQVLQRCGTHDALVPEPFQRLSPGITVRGDDLLVGGACAAVLDERRRLGDPAGRGLRVGQDGAEQLPAVLVAAVPGQSQPHRALALAQIVSGGFAGDPRRAEDAQFVVAQLEGDADLLAEDGQVLGGRAGRVHSGQEGADEQRVAHRIPGRLMAHDRQGVVVHPSRGDRGILPPGQRQVLTAHVEELAQGNLGGHGIEGGSGVSGRSMVGLRGGVRTRQGAHLLTGQGQQEVAEQDGAVGPEGLRTPQPAACLVVPGEGAVCREQPPPGVGPVHEVVVDQGAGLVELERRTQVDGVGSDQPLCPVLRGGQESAADRAQHSAHALAPAEDASGGLEQLRRGRPQALPAPTAHGQDFLQTVLDGGTDAAQGRRQRAHDRQSRRRTGFVASSNGFRPCGGAEGNKGKVILSRRCGVAGE